jgi:hypothetical protein
LACGIEIFGNSKVVDSYAFSPEVHGIRRIMGGAHRGFGLVLSKVVNRRLDL